MADTASGPESPQGKADPADEVSPEDEQKRKFREALERKHDTHATAEGAQDGSKVHGSRGPAVSRRSFRRKSGG